MINRTFHLRAWLGRHIGNKAIQMLLHMKTDRLFAEHYGDFHFGESFRRLNISASQESGKIHGTIVVCLQTLKGQVQRLLLAGDATSTKPIYAELLGMDVRNIHTAGLHEDMDIIWNYEDNPTITESYDCIVSQSMLEHLIDPYKHLRDCHALLKPRGHMIIHTVMPGFGYHRYPVDCLRFYPDWFEEVAKRLNCTVVDKFIRNARITYMMQR